MLTDNKVILERMKSLPALQCAQRKAEKKISSEEDFIASNVASFGNEIGQTTNWITSMYEVRAEFDPGSQEYEELTYRIQNGELYQQNIIDSAKGIIAKPMPRSWHDRHAVNAIEDEGVKDFYRSIVADKKPYFMKYIYPALSKEYSTYIKSVDKNAFREFGLSLNELRVVPEAERTERQNDFLRYCDKRMPVGTNDCVMNKICRRFEEEFDGYIGRTAATKDFDYTVMKGSGEYTQRQFYSVKALYEEYNSRLKNYSIFANMERVDKDEAATAYLQMNEEFVRACSAICQNTEVLCNLLLDLCYTRSSTKRFVWSICGEQIVENLLEKNDRTISFPELSVNGDVEYGGKHFEMKTMRLEGLDIDSYYE